MIMTLQNPDMVRALDFLRQITVAGVRQSSPDLTARQLAVLLTVYVSGQPQTVRGLAAELKVTKPAITRALDKLGAMGLLQRRRDQQNRRSIFVEMTPQGAAHMAILGGEILSAMELLQSAPSRRIAA